MKKVLIFGGTGLLGQSLVKTFEKNKNILLHTTIRKKDANIVKFFNKITKTIEFEFQEENINDVDKIIDLVRPDIIINCIAVLNEKEIPLSKMLFINSIFPHKLNEACIKYLSNYFLVQISSDAIYNGTKGNFSENDKPQPMDFYGVSKLAGELQDSNCLNIRTSFYGLNFLYKNNNKGIFNWFINSTEKQINGYKNYYFSGLSTINLASEIKNIILEDKLRGVVNISASKISKLELLILINNNLKDKKIISPTEDPYTDLTLKSLYREEYSISHYDMVKNIFTFSQLQ